jgi:hypothetical protein
VTTWLSVGYLAGDHIEAIYTDVTRYFLYVVIAAAVLLAGWIGLRVRAARRRRAARTPDEEDPADGDPADGDPVEPQASDRS